MLRLLLPSMLAAMEGSLYLRIRHVLAKALGCAGILFALQNHLNLVVPSPGGTLCLLPP